MINIPGIGRQLSLLRLSPTIAGSNLYPYIPGANAPGFMLDACFAGSESCDYRYENRWSFNQAILQRSSIGLLRSREFLDLIW